jgi:hypothetical protein
VFKRGGDALLVQFGQQVLSRLKYNSEKLLGAVGPGRWRTVKVGNEKVLGAREAMCIIQDEAVLQRLGV